MAISSLHSTVLDSLGHRVHILVEMKQGQCICPLSWSVHSNFSGEGKCNERGWACTPHPHQPGQILPSSLNVCQKAAVATLCTLCSWLWFSICVEKQLKHKYILVGKIADELLHEKQFVEYIIEFGIAKNFLITDPAV